MFGRGALCRPQRHIVGVVHDIINRAAVFSLDALKPLLYTEFVISMETGESANYVTNGVRFKTNTARLLVS